LKELQKRSISGLLFAAVLLGAILYGPWSFALLFAVFSAFILKEFYQLSRTAGISPQRSVGMAVGVLIFAFTFLHLKGVIAVHPLGIFLTHSNSRLKVLRFFSLSLASTSSRIAFFSTK